MNYTGNASNYAMVTKRERKPNVECSRRGYDDWFWSTANGDHSWEAIHNNGNK